MDVCQRGLDTAESKRVSCPCRAWNLHCPGIHSAATHYTDRNIRAFHEITVEVPKPGAFPVISNLVSLTDCETGQR